MIVEAEVVDRDNEFHLLRTEDGQLFQAEFFGEWYRIGERVLVELPS